MHFHAGADCDALALRARALLAQAEAAGLLFPEALTVTKAAAPARAGRPNGGWADPRDRQLCLDNANASLHRWGQAQ